MPARSIHMLSLPASNDMKNASSWFLCGVLSVLCLQAPSMLAKALHASPSMNIVLFLIDDLGWMDLGCQGSSYYQTPHIDSLASQGARFTDAYAVAPFVPLHAPPY